MGLFDSDVSSGLVRGATILEFAPGAEGQIELNRRGEQIVVQGLPERAEIVRLGQSYVVQGTGVAPVSALPTTAAHLTLYNNEQAGGKSYIIDWIMALETTSSAAAISIDLAWSLTDPAALANPAGALVIRSLSGKPNYGGQGNAKASVALPAAPVNVWIPALTATLVTANVANLMSKIVAPMYGLAIVRPQAAFSVAGLANAAGAAVLTPYIIYHEVQLDLG